MYANFLNTPGLKIVAASNPYDCKGLLKSAIRDDNPVLLFEHLKLGGKKGMVPDEEYLIPLGEAKVVREGKDVTMVGIAWTVDLALQAAEKLASEGVSVEVIDLRTIVPWDKERILKSVRKTGRIVIVDEAHKTGSVASEISASIVEEAFDHLKAPIRRVCSLDVPIPFSPPMENYVIPDVDKVQAAVREVMSATPVA